MKKYQEMLPEQHLKFMFNANVDLTDQHRYKKGFVPIGNIAPSIEDIATNTEKEVTIKMGEEDYKNFIESYGRYLNIIHSIEDDPIATEMFHKFLTYITLKY